MVLNVYCEYTYREYREIDIRQKITSPSKIEEIELNDGFGCKVCQLLIVITQFDFNMTIICGGILYISDIFGQVTRKG